jgi:D-amino-acid dehydrogenase
LAIRARYLLPILPWLTRLLLASRPTQLAQSIEAIVAINQLAMPAWNALSHQLGMANFIHRRGALFAYDSQASLQRARAHHQRQRAFGISVDELDGPALRQMEPGLSEALVGAAYYPDAAHVSDPRLVTEALFAACHPRGIGFLRGDVAGLTPTETGITLSLVGQGQIAMDRVIIAAGAWSRPLTAQLGDRIPLDTERGYNVSFPGITAALSRPVSFDGHGFVATPLETGLRIGGAVELGGLVLPPNHQRTRALHAKAQRFLQGVPPIEQGEMWMGHRPSIPDSLPVIGAARVTHAALYAFGHGHYGLTQSAATGRIIADLIAGRTPPIGLAPFSPQRF